MSNNKGKRQLQLKNRKEVKEHVKMFNKILKYLDELAAYLIIRYPDVEFTAENINEYTREYLERDLDNMEVNVILGKLNSVKKDDNA